MKEIIKTNLEISDLYLRLKEVVIQYYPIDIVEELLNSPLFDKLNDLQINKIIEISKAWYLPLLITFIERNITDDNFLRLFHYAVKDSNFYMLRSLKDKFQVQFDNIKNLTNNQKKYKFNYKIFEKMQFSLNESFSSWSLQDINFLNTISGFIVKDSLSYQGALLTISQIRNRKFFERVDVLRYEFSPTVLTYEDFSEYLATLKECPFPLREKFLLTGVHWLCGEISIDKDNNVQILLLDASGDAYLGNLLGEAVEMVYENFSSPVIYLDVTKKQRKKPWCYFFALDDLRHLYTAERYLPAPYNETGLFAYLKSRIIEVKEVKIEANSSIIAQITLTSLPLSLMLNMHSRELINEEGIIKKRSLLEQQTPVNKKGEIALISADKDFIHVTPYLRRNMRLKRKIESMTNKNINYILSQEKSAIEKNMELFTLAGFKKQRLSSSNSKKRNFNHIPSSENSSDLLAKKRKLIMN